MPRRKKRNTQLAKSAKQGGGRPKKQKKIDEGQTVLNWSSKGGQKGSSGRARDGPKEVTGFMFSSKKLLGQWGLVIL